MKFLLLCCFFAVVALSQAQTPRLQDKYEASLDAWQTLNPRAYTYVVISEVLVGDPEKYQIGRTTIKVRNGQPVARSYVQKETLYYPGEVVDSWTEDTQTSIGTSQGGSPALPFDHIYSECLNILSSPAEDSSDYAILEVDSNGLISKCGFYGLNTHSYINIENVRYCR